MVDSIYELNIRATNPNGFRPGEWAKVKHVVWIKNRPCYEVEFVDGRKDYWVIHDPSDPYEFRKGEAKDWW